MNDNADVIESTRNGLALWYYLAPYLAYVGVLMAPAAWVSRPILYAVAAVASAVALAAGWRVYLPLWGVGSRIVSVLVGVVAGVAGTALWVVFKAPFYEAGGEAWPLSDFWARLAASSTVVPVFEELLFRGFLMLGVIQWQTARRAGVTDAVGEVLDRRSVHELPRGAWSWLAMVVTTVAFALGHVPGEWLAATVYGLLMAGLWVLRKDLMSCIVAHAVTNATLALWVRSSGNWNLW